MGNSSSILDDTICVLHEIVRYDSEYELYNIFGKSYNNIFYYDRHSLKIKNNAKDHLYNMMFENGFFISKLNPKGRRILMSLKLLGLKYKNEYIKDIITNILDSNI